MNTKSIVYRDLIDAYQVRPPETPAVYEVVLQAPEIDRLGNRVAVRGILKTVGSSSHPVNWFQGVTVYLAATPGEVVDWSKGFDQSKMVGSNAFVTPAGEFRAVFDLRELKHDHRQGPARYQIGMALASHIGDRARMKVKWPPSSPVLPSTIQQITIPRSPAISEPLRLVNGACDYRRTNGADFIRAVNALQRLGKKQALEALTEFLREPGPTDYDKLGVFFIVRLLFEPTAPGGFPVPELWSNGPAKEQWPLTPMACVFDVPFLLAVPIGFGGPPEPEATLTWVQNNAELRAGPLKPIDPLSAVEFMIRGSRFKSTLAKMGPDGDALSVGMRQQAITMLEVDSMPGIDAEFRQRLPRLKKEPQPALLKPFDRTLLKQFKWNHQLQRFVPKSLK